MPGGVCAVLDYDVEMMADYVAEMATRLSMGHSDVSGAFRKFVSQILTSTRLPSTTILLGMNYMAKKLNVIAMNSGQRPKMTEGQLWRMVTIAFLLGSKFLDDNTFQNRSWSEVSGIAVQELNTLEQEWLAAIGWSLYVNLDRSKDYGAWLKSWQEWQENTKRQQARATRERLLPLVPPIDTDVLRSRNTHSYAAWHRQQVAEYERLQNLNLKRNELSPQSTVSSQDPWYPRGVGHWNMANGAHCSHPLTPPDSGYGTPEVYLGSAILNSNTPHDVPYNDWFARGLANAAYTRQGQYQHQTASRSVYSGGRPHSTHTGYYGYGHSIWEPSIADCNCANCISSAQSKHQSYFGMTHSYGQPVMG